MQLFRKYAKMKSFMQINQFNLTFDVRLFRKLNCRFVLIRCEMVCLSNCSNVHRFRTIHEYFPFDWIIVQRNTNAIYKWIYNWIVHNVSVNIFKWNCCDANVIDSILSRYSYHALFIILWFRSRKRDEEINAGIRNISNSFFFPWEFVFLLSLFFFNGIII